MIVCIMVGIYIVDVYVYLIFVFGGCIMKRVLFCVVDSIYLCFFSKEKGDNLFMFC